MKPTLYAALISVAAVSLTQSSTLRNKAVDKAWEIEKNAVKTGTSRYNWTIKQKLEILKNGKVAGYEGHHIKTVKELEGTAKEFLVADPNNIVFVTKKQHFFITWWQYPEFHKY